MTLDFSKQSQSPIESAYRFGPFELHPRERLLKRKSSPVPLQPKVFDALLLLVSRAGHLVSRQELTSQLWPDVHVSERNLTNMVVALRKLLGRDAVRTVSKHGYRFEMPLIGEPGIAPSVYEKFLHARHLIEQRSLEQMQVARDLLWIVLAEDPSFAPGWAWLGRCCWFLDKFDREAAASAELARAALRRALALAPDLTDAHQFSTFLEVDAGHAADAIERLLDRVQSHSGEPEMYASLVQALRFEGLLKESVEAHHRAIDLDPGAVTSVAHTLFFQGDFASAIEAYSGRAAYYLDAAAWAAVGLRDRAISLLRRRLRKLLLSKVMTALMTSLLAVLEGRKDEAIRAMESAEVNREPEIVAYFARHYALLGFGEAAAVALNRAADEGFICAPETLRRDPWLGALRKSAAFKPLLSRSEARVKSARARVTARLRGTVTASGRTADGSSLRSQIAARFLDK
jgi:DNA-binding winged helix-turn-helix (wHTH) protein/tetratricopeptide (TPR) repeat protein